MPLHMKLSRELSRRVKAKVGECGINAAKGHCFLKGSIFVGGLVLCPDREVREHCWIESKYGSIIDPTLSFELTINDVKQTIYFPQIKETIWNDSTTSLVFRAC